jgi:hypothetical protein
MIPVADLPDRAVFIEADDGTRMLMAVRKIVRPPGRRPYVDKLVIEQPQGIEGRWLGVLRGKPARSQRKRCVPSILITFGLCESYSRPASRLRTSHVGLASIDGSAELFDAEKDTPADEARSFVCILSCAERII